jgi:exopolyphosphatase/guanosine-5'-triphosphate,3'-diphosphate pyrophosphatase
VRCACIDIGSNTTRLLVADCAAGVIAEVHQDRAFTRIGGVIGGDLRIPDAKIDEVAAVVARQLAVARELGAGAIRAVATAAVRRAVNGVALTAAIEHLCGVPVEILSEPEEARLAFIGAARTLTWAPEGELAVIDVGGGSSELAIGTVPDQVRWSLSLPVGSGDLADRFLRSDPPLPSQLAAARAEVAALLDSLLGVGRVQLRAPAAALAVGGSATSLRLLVGDRLDQAALDRALTTLCGLPSRELAGEVGLDQRRVRLMPAGLVILEAVAAALGVAPEIGNGGIREGVVLALAGAGP